MMEESQIIPMESVVEEEAENNDEDQELLKDLSFDAF